MKHFKEPGQGQKKRDWFAPSGVSDIVAEIIRDVSERKDAALAEYEKKFSRSDRTSFRVSAKEVKAAYGDVPKDLVKAVRTAAENIRDFARAQLETVKELPLRELRPGVWLGHRMIPADSCCCYVPGGRYPLFSTALMLAVPAKAAGVRRVFCCTPVVKGSDLPHAATLVALDIAGVNEIYAVGGAQAIAAAACGTETIPAADLIVGPGNVYVTEAKRQVYGRVGIDFVAGPSEVLIIADETADPEIVAADLLAQSEHDPEARGILVTTSEELAARVADETERLLKEIDTKATARLSWNARGEILVAGSLEEAVEYSNKMAPEHLEVNTKNPEALLGDLKNYGALFLGSGSAEVFGDYVAGTNHTLPTMGAARYTGGLWAGTFLKTCTYQKITSEGIEALAPAAEIMAQNEGLSAHALAARLRRNRKEG
ncbi:MAG: histidinol dehydrogenase [Thermovirgaceae bacterium]